MALSKFKTLCSLEKVLQILEEDPGDPVCPVDSSSSDEDLVHPDSGYYVSPSESDDDCEPPSSHQTETGPSSRPPAPAPHPQSPAPQTTADSTGPLTPTPDPTPTTQLQRGCPTRRASAPLPPLSDSSDADSSEEWKPKRKGKAMHTPASKRSRGGSATPRVSEEEERWHGRHERDKKPDRLRFTPASIPGPTFDTTASWSPLALFRLFFSPSVIRTLVKNTNANAAKRQKAGKKFKWEELTVKDFYLFLAIIVFSGLVKVHSRADYWRKKFPYSFLFPADKMTRGRFEAILWSLHLSNPEEDEENESKRNTAEYDRLFKIKPLYTEMVEACKAHFRPYQNISIDERMVATKARISLKQYMKNKPTKWGYKLFVLADASTAYTWNFFVYTGRNESTTGQGLSYSAVMDLLPFSLLGGGYTVYTDNFYTSPALFQDLAKKNFGCCGTIRRSCVGFPQNLSNDLPKKAERGDLRWIRRNDLLFVKWMDTREVTMCSSVHEAFSGQTVKRRVKEAGVWKIQSIPVPDAVVDYNGNMGGVDVSDALIGYYSVHHKTMKWYKTFFYHFMDIAVVNSFLLHKELFKLRHDPAQTKPHTQKSFREQLTLELVEASAPAPPTEPAPAPATCMPMFYPNEESRIRKHCKRCLQAGIVRVKTTAFCRKCQVPLCLSSKKNCYQLWHDGQ